MRFFEYIAIFLTAITGGMALEESAFKDAPKWEPAYILKSDEVIVGFGNNCGLIDTNGDRERVLIVKQRTSSRRTNTLPFWKMRASQLEPPNLTHPGSQPAHQTFKQGAGPKEALTNVAARQSISSLTRPKLSSTGMSRCPRCCVPPPEIWILLSRMVTASPMPWLPAWGSTKLWLKIFSRSRSVSTIQRPGQPRHPRLLKVQWRMVTVALWSPSPLRPDALAVSSVDALAQLPRLVPGMLIATETGATMALIGFRALFPCAPNSRTTLLWLVALDKATSHEGSRLTMLSQRTYRWVLFANSILLFSKDSLKWSDGAIAYRMMERKRDPGSWMRWMKGVEVIKWIEITMLALPLRLGFSFYYISRIILYVSVSIYRNRWRGFSSCTYQSVKLGRLGTGAGCYYFWYPMLGFFLN